MQLARRQVTVTALQAAVLLLALPAILPPRLEAATIRVPADQPTVQAGLAAAAPGDTVLVAPGTYVGPGNRDLDFGGRDLVLRSSAGSAATVLDAQGAGRVLDFHGGETAAAVVEGFTIRGGEAGAYFGGGVRCLGASPTFQSCAIVANHGNEGGGMYFEQASPSIVDCAFTANRGDNWGGGIRFLDSSPQVSGCTFTGNTAARGGGAEAEGSPVTFSSCTFRDNLLAVRGGALVCRELQQPVVAHPRPLRLHRQRGGGNPGQ